MSDDTIIAIAQGIRARDKRAASNFAVTEASPDATGRANVLARDMGLPADFVDRNLSAIEKQALQIRAREAIRRYPTIGIWGNDPRNAAMAGDDLGPLSNVAKSFTSRLTPSSFTRAGASDMAGDAEIAAATRQPGAIIADARRMRPVEYGIAVRDIVSRSAGEVASRLTAADLQALPLQAARGAGAGFYDLSAGLYGVGRAVGENVDAYSPISAAERALFGASLYGKLGQFFGEAQKRVQAGGDEVGGAPARNRYMRDIVSGFRSMPTSASALALAAVGQPEVGAALVAGQVGGTEYAKARARKLDPARAALYAATQGVVEFGTERIPALRYFEDTRVGASFVRKLANNLGSEMPQEQVATVLQDLNEWAALNPDKPFSDYLSERPNAALSTAIATAVGSTVTVGTTEALGSLVSNAAKNAAKRQEAAQAEADAAFLKQLADGVAASKVAKRDPSAFARFLEMQADGSTVENVYIPGEALREYFQSEGMDYRGEDSPFSFDPGIADQIEEALATGGDVVIPTAQFATNLAGTPVWDALKEQVRLSPGGASLAEARNFAEAYDSVRQQMGEDFARQMEQERASREPREKLYQAIRDKLVAAGFTQNAADTNASLVTARYVTRAARRGETLTGNEFDGVEVNQVLPPRLAPIVAADQLDIVVDAMKRQKVQRTAAQKFGPSLLDWIASQGGIEDRGGDLKSMGAAEWHRGKPGRRKLLRPTQDDSPTFIPLGQQNANTPDELALRAQEAGFLPMGERPTIADLYDAIERELRGQPVYAEDRSGMTDQVREAADDLAALLEQEGLDPATASKQDIRAAVSRYQAEQMGGRGYEQTEAARDAKWQSQLSDFRAGRLKGSQALQLGKAGLPFRALGINGAVRIHAGKLKKITDKHDQLPGAVIDNLPAIFADPYAILPGQANDGRTLVVLRPVAEDGSPIVASLEPDARTGNQIITLFAMTTDAPERITRAFDSALQRGEVVYVREGFAGVTTASEAAAAFAVNSPLATKDPRKAAKLVLDKAAVSKRFGRSLDQSYMDGPRGRITFGAGRTVIDMFQARDPSTFLHETGHLWLEELRADAEAEGASDQVRADWATVQAWFKANGQPLAADGSIPVEAHELWARGVERFLMEGKAPSTGLRKVFDTFRSWLLAIYQVVNNLRAPITPEIREVMSRLIATDAEIEDARQEQGIKALFTDAAQAGMTEATFAQYQKLVGEARDEAFDALLYRTMSTIRRERTKAWREERDAVRSEVAARVDARPEFKALGLLRSREQPIKLDRAWLVENYGQDVLAMLPGAVPPIFADQNTTAAEDVAEMAGFPTADEMVRTLISLGERTREMRAEGDQRSVRQAMIDDETAAEMRDRHGDPLSDGSIEEEALALIHNDRQGEVIASELRALGAKSNRRPTPYALARQWAAETIAQSKVADSLSGAALQRYAKAARQAAAAAEQAMLKGDADETFRQKQRQMLNNALIAEAGKAKAAVDAAATRLAKVAKRATMRSVDQDYLDQAHGLLEQVDFRDRSQRSIDRQESFEAWAAAREAEGFDVVVPASFAATIGSRNWTRLTVEELLGLRDAVDQVLHLGRLKQTLIDNQERREFDAVVAEAVDAAGKLPPRAPSDLMEPDWGDRMKAGVASFDAALLKIETLVDWLDGGRSDGVFNRIVFRPIAEAQDRENDMRLEYQERVVDAMKALPPKTIKRWQERVAAPELLNRETGRPWQMTRQQLVSMALNMGNDGNIQRLTDGYGWSEEGVRAVLDRELRAEDWAFVQQVWDIIDTLWPQIAAMEKRLNGIEPERVEAKGFTNAHGTFRGGYYPVVYDSTKSIEAEVNQGKAADLFETVYTRATTRASATKNRMEKVNRPILLDLGVINRHLGEVIHDITHREAIMQAARFLEDRRVVGAIDGSLGPEIRKQFRPWLKYVANQWAMERLGHEGVSKWIMRGRANATMVGMGFRITTVITQVAGYANIIGHIGEAAFAKAVAQVAASPIRTARFVLERSGEVRGRLDNTEREVRMGIAGLRGEASVFAEARRFAFLGIGWADRMVVIPGWIGAYNKALSDGMSETDAIYAADKMVRTSQGATGAKDMSAVQRDRGLMALFTMFYSFVAAQYQQHRSLMHDTRMASLSDIPSLLSRAFWLVVVPPLLSAILTGHGPDDDEDWGYWAFKNMTLNVLGPIPVLRDAAPAVWAKVDGSRSFGYQMSPLQRAGDSIVNALGDVGNLVTGEETRRATRHALEAAGYLTGLVPGQLASAAQFLVDVAEGAQDPETVAEWYEGLTKGKIADQ